MSSEIKSPTVGLIAMVLAEDGATVAAGEVVAQVECMKTFFDVAAPTAGVVKWNIEPGSQVAQDEILGVVE